MGLNGNLFQAFLDYLYSTSSISVPTEFHEKCSELQKMLDNDITGLINTILDYSINSASEANYSIECENENLQELLNLWLDNINININGVPTGLNELAKEYYKERWAGSSLCILRVDKWKKISKGNNSIEVPTVLWFVNGSSVYIKRKDKTNFKLGTDEYYLDKNLKNKLPKNKDENIIINKPFNRWFAKYASPYLIRKGTFKNYLAIKLLQEKGDEVISKVLPYLFMIDKGTENLFIQKINYTQDDYDKVIDNFQEALKEYKSHGSKVPVNVKPFDQKYQHLIPDLRNILTEELYKQGNRFILSSLGFIDVIQGLSSTRKEAVVNPEPFIAEVNAGVEGFKTILLEIINLIKFKNDRNRKFFSDNHKIKAVNSPLKINVQKILDQLRTAYIYGTLSIKTYQETLGLDPDKERERIEKEWENGDRQIFYPKIIQNLERDEDIIYKKEPPMTKKEEEKENEKTKAIEEKKIDIIKCPSCNLNFECSIELNKNFECPKCKTTVTKENIVDAKEILEALQKKDITIAPYNLKNIPSSVKRLPKKLQKLWIEVWNNTYDKYHDESRAHRTAWYVVNKERNKLKKEKSMEQEKKKKEIELLDTQLGIAKKLERDNNENI